MTGIPTFLGNRINDFYDQIKRNCYKILRLFILLIIFG